MSAGNKIIIATSVTVLIGAVVLIVMRRKGTSVVFDPVTKTYQTIYL